MTIRQDGTAPAGALAGALVAVCGGLVLAAHVAGLRPADPAQLWPLGMVFNAALGFLLGGLALALAAVTGSPPLVRALAGAVLVLGGVSLAQVVTGLDLGIDQLLWRVPAELGRATPGRIAPITALSFVVVGTALLVRVQWPRVLAASLVTMVCAWALVIIGVLDLAATVLGVSPESRFPNGSQLPWFSALQVLICGAGLLELGGWRHSSRLLLVRSALGAGVLMLLVGTVLSHLSRGQERLQVRRTTAAFASGTAVSVDQHVRDVYRALQTSAALAEVPGITPDAWSSLVAQEIGAEAGAVAIEAWMVAGGVPWRVGGYAQPYPVPAPDSTALAPATRMRSTPTMDSRWPRPIVVERTIRQADGTPGVVRLVWDAHAALDTLVRDLELAAYAIDVRFGPASLFRNAHADRIPAAGPVEERVLAEGASTLVFRLWPTPAALVGQRSGLPILIQTVACALAVLIALGLHYLRLAQRRAEELERTHAALESSQARLREAERLEAVGQLAGGVAHEFNNLLTSIRGYAASALEGAAAVPAVQGDLREVLAASDRAAEVTARLLAVGQRQLMMPERVPLAELVDRALGRIQATTGLRLRVDAGVEGDRATVLVDPARFEEMLRQLVRNAAAAMGAEGEVAVATGVHVGALQEPDARPERPAGTYFWVEVRDTGPGMAPDTMRRLLEPFRTLQPRAGGHTGGLGLAAVFGMVAQSGGALGLRSTPGEGTAVRVYLPEAPSREATPSAPAPEPTPGQAPLVLVVEDEAPIRSLAGRALRSAGYDVHEAESARAALELLDALPRPPALVVTDVLMPGMQGSELAERLRARLPSVAVLFISGYAADQLSAQGIRVAGAAFLRKPFSLQELVTQVERLVPRRADAPAPVP